MSYISEDVLEQIYGFDTAKDVWICLDKFYVSKSKPRVI